MRNPAVPQGLFKPKPTAIETKQDATTKAARAIIDTEASARDRKTERLKLARLAQEEAEAEKPAPQKKPAAKRKKA
jgi:hypothetical protein